MQVEEFHFSGALDLLDADRAKFLLINGDAKALEAYTSLLRRDGHEVYASPSFPEGSSCPESEHFDLMMVKMGGLPDSEDERFWKLRAGSAVDGPSCSWHSATTGDVAWVWRTWEPWAN